MKECPECGKEQEKNSVTCSNCQYLFGIDDIADYEAHEIAFTVTFQCRNCWRTFKHGFAKGDEVRPKGSGHPEFQINEVAGNQYLAVINGGRCRPQCPTCGHDSSLSVKKRTPIRER